MSESEMKIEEQRKAWGYFSGWKLNKTCFDNLLLTIRIQTLFFSSHLPLNYKEVKQ